MIFGGKDRQNSRNGEFLERCIVETQNFTFLHHPAVPHKFRYSSTLDLISALEPSYLFTHPEQTLCRTARQTSSTDSKVKTLWSYFRINVMQQK